MSLGKVKKSKLTNLNDLKAKKNTKFYLCSSNIIFIYGFVDISKLYCQSINKIHPKRAFLLPIKVFHSINSFCGGSLIHVKNFHLSNVPGALGMVRNSFLYPIFDQIMRNLIPSGIPQYLPKLHSRLLFGYFKEIESKIPKVLVLDDLEFGFIMWLIACGISIAAFLSEILKDQIIKAAKRYAGLIVLLTLIRQRF